MADEKCILDPQRDCLGLQKAEMLEKQMDQWRAQSRESHQEIFRRLNDLEKSETARDVQYTSIMEKLDKLVAWQEAQQAKPAKRWDAVIEKAILAVVAAVIGAILARIGL